MYDNDFNELLNIINLKFVYMRRNMFYLISSTDY